MRLPVLFLFMCSACDQGNHGGRTDAAPSDGIAMSSPATDAKATDRADIVTARDVLPARFIVHGRGPLNGTIEITDTAVRLWRHKDGQSAPSATMSIDLKQLDSALSAAHGDDLRGFVRYTHPYLRDAVTERLITPMGEISVCGVYGDRDGAIKWPRAVIRLEGIFQLCRRWYNELTAIEKQQEQQKHND